jgi:hypothetical protein
MNTLRASQSSQFATPTSHLRFFNGTLQQLFEVQHYGDGGPPAFPTQEWRDVPNVIETPKEE